MSWYQKNPHDYLGRDDVVGAVKFEGGSLTIEGKVLKTDKFNGGVYCNLDFTEDIFAPGAKTDTASGDIVYNVGDLDISIPSGGKIMDTPETLAKIAQVVQGKHHKFTKVTLGLLYKNKEMLNTFVEFELNNVLLMGSNDSYSLKFSTGTASVLLVKDDGSIGGALPGKGAIKIAGTAPPKTD